MLANQTALVSLYQAKALSLKRVKKQKDRFGIMDMKDINKLLEVSRNRLLNLELNDYVSIFLRITVLH